MIVCTNSEAAIEWTKADPAGTRNAADIDLYVTNNNTALDRVLGNYREGMALVYDSASQITASSGEVVCSNSDGSTRKMRQNTSNTTVTWADIDTGSEASATTYYIYANCDADATTATFKVSASSSSPSGVTSYKKLGSFYNDGSSNIDRKKIYTEPYGFPFSDSSGIPQGITVYDYGTSTSSSTARNISTYWMTSHTVADDSTITLSPAYTSSSSYIISCTMESGTISQNVRISSKSASGFTIGDGLGNGNTINCITFGY